MKFEQSISIDAEPAEIFAEFTKVSDWPVWDPETESAHIDGDFVVGATGKIKPKGSPTTKIELTEVTQDKSFTVECGLPLCKMHFVHLMEKMDTGTNVVNQLEFTGLLAPVFGRLFGKSINKSIPESLSGLKNHIESRR